MFPIKFEKIVINIFFCLVKNLNILCKQVVPVDFFVAAYFFCSFSLEKVRQDILICICQCVFKTKEWTHSIDKKYFSSAVGFVFVLKKEF